MLRPSASLIYIPKKETSADQRRPTPTNSAHEEAEKLDKNWIIIFIPVLMPALVPCSSAVVCATVVLAPLIQVMQGTTLCSIPRPARTVHFHKLVPCDHDDHGLGRIILVRLLRIGA